MYVTLLIQFLNVCKSLFFLLFYPKVHYQTINFFLAVNQHIIAKLDNFSLLQIIETNPELRFKYMGSYPSDTVPQLTKYSFAIINSAQAMIEENTVL